MSSLSVSEVIVGITYLLLGPHAFYWATVHIYKMYQDLYTKERKSVSFRRSPPKRTKVYKLMSWLTSIGIISFGFAVVSSVGAVNFSTGGVDCFVFSILVAGAWQFAKPAMFLTYILRLHQCYSLSAFGYGKKKLTCLAIFIIIFAMFVIIAMMIGMALGKPSNIDQDGKFPYVCTRDIPEEFGPSIAVGVLVFDFIFTIGSIFAFIIPINRLFKALAATKGDSSSKNDKNYRKMLYAGTKYKVLVFCASTTSVLWVAYTMIGRNITVTYILSGIDFTINMFCLMLMTPYYPDGKYYQRLCHICVCCCDRRKESYKSKASQETEDEEEKERKKKELEPSSTNPASTTNISSTGQTNVTSTSPNSINAKSVDTMDAVEIVAGQTGNKLLNTVNSGSDEEDP